MSLKTLTAATFVASLAFAPLAHADITIGLIAPLTGPVAAYGEQVKNGAQTAIEEINKSGGVLGQKLVLKLGDDAGDLDRVNQGAIGFLREIAEDWGDRISDIRVVGMVGPRGDGYAAGSASNADEAAEYHAAQVVSFAAAGADEVEGLTMTDTYEALGVARAAEAAGVPAVLSFTVETDGRLPDGTALGDAVSTIDRDTPPAYFMVNCAHPQHVLPALEGAGPWVDRVRGVRSNASTQSHAELDEAESLDEGDLGVLVPAHRELEKHLPALEIVGGCCGTDARHVAALWGV